MDVTRWDANASGCATLDIILERMKVVIVIVFQTLSCKRSSATGIRCRHQHVRLVPNPKKWKNIVTGSVSHARFPITQAIAASMGSFSRPPMAMDVTRWDANA